jgi:hypothetical protein
MKLKFFVLLFSVVALINVDTGSAVELAIDIEKSTNGFDADVSPGPEIIVGDDVLWEYVVTNTGPVPLSDVLVADSEGVPVSCPQVTLAPGESMTCTASGVATPGQYENLGTAIGVDPSGNVVEDADPSHYFGVGNPAIDIEKTTNGFDADAPPGPQINVGDPIEWAYLVANNGNVTLGNVVVSDNQGVVVQCPTDTLAPGESMTCTASGVATQGPYENIGIARGDSPSGNEVVDEDSSHYVGVGCLVSADCDNGDYCDGDESCDADTGECLPAGLLPCVPGYAGCLRFDGSCDEDFDVCNATPDDSQCAAGEFCNADTAACETIPSAPDNDLCEDAISINVGDIVLGSTTDATVDALDFCGTTINAPGVWYSVAGTGNVMVASTCGDFFDYDTKISVFCKNCAEPVCIGGNDDNCVGGASGLLSTVEFESQAGAEYLILVHGFGGQTGDFELTVLDTGTPSIDPVICYIDPATTCPGSSSGEYFLETWENEFEDISGSGTESIASHCDDCGENVPLGFVFNFFGIAKSDVGISSNGYLTFGPDLSDFSNDPIPTAIDPNDLIAPLWDDLNPSQGGSVHHQSDGSNFIAQWTNVPEFFNIGSNTFQAVLYNGSNAIEYRYWEFTPEAFPGDYTVGIENADGTEGVSVDAATILPGDCIRFVPSNPFPYIDIKPGSNPNCVNTRSGGVIPVAILGRDDFNVYDIISDSVMLDGLLAERCVYEDVYPEDGIMDLSCKFKAKDIPWPDFSANPSNCALMIVTGTLLDGTTFEAVDWVCDAGGTFCENGTSTAVCNGDPEPEACCLPDGTCVELVPEECAFLGGVPHGAGTDCAAVDCPAPPEPQACCLSNGDCFEGPPDECLNQGGFPNGPGSNCALVECLDPNFGACCLPDGGCAEGPLDLCIDQGGAYQGDGTECAQVDCPGPPEPEACCLPNGDCLEGPSDLCINEGGIPNGPGSNCEAANCIPAN